MKSILRMFHSSSKDDTPMSTMQDLQNSTNPAGTSHSHPQQQPPLSTQPLTVIELFQSQGCNSCPPTNANLLSLHDQNTLLLTYHVTYWDYLGWTDTFGASAFDQRQRDYVRALGLRSAFTPQVVVNGMASGVGNTGEGLAKVVREGTRSPAPGVGISVEGDGVVRVAAQGLAGERGHALEVWLVRFDPLLREVHIKNGENRGRVLPHRNLVKFVERVGEARVGEESAWTVRRGDDGLRSVVLVQYGRGGPVVGAKIL